MIRVLPTAPQIFHPRRRELSSEAVSVFDGVSDVPTLQCEVTKSGTQVRFRCGFCNRYHLHGNVPKDSPDKGNRGSHCRSDVYQRGYYLRTDLDKIYPKRYPNFTVVNGGEKVSNAHYRRCERLELPTVTVRCERNYAWLDIDFMDINYRMDKILRLMIDTIGADYRKLRQRYVRGKRHSLGYISLHHNSSREMATFKIFINDAYPIADVLMPLINDRSYWVQR